MPVFGMNMEEMTRLGTKMTDLSDQFGAAKNKLNRIVQGLVDSDYTSDDAKALANAIKSYEPLLIAIQNKLGDYGNFATGSSNLTSATNEEIKSNIANNLEMK